MTRATVSAVVLVAAFAAFVPSAYAVRDFSSDRAQHHPVGPVGAVPVPAAAGARQADGQAKLYDGLTPLFDKVTPQHLNRYFKSEKLGTKGQGPLTRERVPRKGVRIIRDRFNVPHIYGKTNDDVTWGAGWALAHDRELLLEQARYNARVAVVDAPGQTAIDLIVGLKSFSPSAQTEREVRKEVAKLKAYGKPGRTPAARHRRLRQGHQRLLQVDQRQALQALEARRRDRPQRRQERAVRRGRRRRGRGRPAARRPAGRRSAPSAATPSGTTCASARTPRRPSRSRALPVRAAARQPQRQRRARQRLVRADPGPDGRTAAASGASASCAARRATS